MHRPSRVRGPLLGAVGWLIARCSNAADGTCWGGDFNEALCCKSRWGLTGNPACWDGEFTYLRCCGLDSFPHLLEEDIRWSLALHEHPVENAEDDFDFIVVGSGSAGSVLAARLAAASAPTGDPWRVLLLEEGPWDKPEASPDPDSPPSDSTLWRGQLHATWETDSRSATWSYATGRGLGGTAAVNSMIYTRGSVSEYEQFGWSTNSVLEAFHALEAFMEVPGFVPDAKFHRAGGKQGLPGYHLSLVSARPEELPPLFRGLISAFEEASVPYRLDPHGSSTIHGIGGVWRSMGCAHPRCQPTRVVRFRNALGRPRSSPYTALVASMNSTGKSNLRVVPNAIVERVVFNDQREAVGVEVSERISGGGELPARRQFYHATKEVILSAGVFNSPKILTLSGIAEQQELTRLDIRNVANSPDVGRHLHEHVGVSIVVGTSVPCPEGYHSSPEGRNTHLGDTHDFIGQFYAFMNASSNVPGSAGPLDVEIMLLEGCLDGSLSLTFTVMLLQSETAGRIVVQARNPFTPLHLDYTPLGHPVDLEVLANAIRFLYTKILPSESLRQFDLTASPPFDTVKSLRSLVDWIRGNIYYYAHPTGTCRIKQMGTSGVVDSRFRVLGVSRLRVADASVFPKSPSGHSDAPSRLVGELASRFILGDHSWKADRDISHKEGLAEPSVPLNGYSGVQMPLRGLGTNGFTGSLAVTSVEGFLRLGGRHIDTALLYKNHADIRTALARSDVPRQTLFLVSKIPPSSMGFEAATSAIDDIVEELGTHVDLLLIHWPANFESNAALPACARPPGSWRFCRAETWRAMESAHLMHKARALGVSNFGVRHLGELLAEPDRTLPVAANQIELHPWWPQNELRDFCTQHRVAVIAYGSLGSSLLGGAMLQAESVVQVAATRLRSPAQVLLRWALQQGIAVIPSSSSEDHLLENLDIVDWELSPSDMRLLSAVTPEDWVRIFMPDPDQAP